LFDLSNKTALVTGAGSGLGRQFALTLAEAGANVVVGARREEKLAETAELVMSRTGQEIDCVALDVTDSASIANAFERAQDRFGVVDIIVNNAGVSRAALLQRMDESDWDVVMDTNLKAVWMVAKEGARRLQEADKPGSIINIASILAFGTTRMLGSYMASKAGVVQLTKAMALEWAAANIRINAIAPGYFPTEMTDGYFETPAGRELIAGIPQRRTGETEELSGPLLLLASDASSYMNGAVIAVDGGHLCRTL
jgi:NAD(P)-dependent dehydrogenase (short-subunit alcohol dehydrogenase family)